MTIWRHVRTARPAAQRFLEHRGPEASVFVALAGFIALFPFLLFVGAVGNLAESEEPLWAAERLLFTLWPRTLALPVLDDFAKAAVGKGTMAAAAGLLLSLWLASGAVEAVRAALCRAYGRPRPPFWRRRLQSLVIACAGAGLLLGLALALALAAHVPPPGVPGASLQDRWLGPVELALGALLFILGTWLAHTILVPGRVAPVVPGLIVGVAGAAGAANGFGAYAASIRDFDSLYGGLAAGLATLILFALIAAMVIFGAEYNAALAGGAADPSASPRKDIAIGHESA